MRTQTSPIATLLTALALAAATALTLGACGSGSSADQSPPETPTNAGGFDGAPFPPGLSAPGFTLTDQSGRPASLAEYRGRVVVLAFLYSDCAPACVLVA